MSNTKWTPGQRLNSAAEVMQALLDLQGIIEDGSDNDDYISLVDGKLGWTDGVETEIPLNDFIGWRIYTPPKRTREVTVWVNVYPREVYTAYHTRGLAEAAADGSDALAVAVPCKITVEW